MLKKKERLTKAEFDHYFKVGRRSHTPTLQLISHPHETFHGAVVVGKKVYKSAVKRNRLRRQLYDVLYKLHRQGVIKNQVYLVIAKPTLARLSRHECKEELTTLLAQFGS